MGKITPTDEQMAVIDAGRAGQSFVVDAVAGSGKTSTLRMAAEAMRGTKILYLVYNRAAKEDAEKAFPSNVEVRTTSSLAWQHACEQYRDRMKPGAARVPSSETAKMLGIKEPLHLGEAILIRPNQMARLASETLDRFAYTADVQIEVKHTPVAPLGLDQAQADALRGEVLRWARKLWMATLNPASRHRFTYDYAWKLHVLGGGPVGHDVIMLDEAQDSNSLTEHFIKKQKNCQRIVVGDPGQAIYGWRGAIDILGRFEGPRLTLSQSWRFGESIAEEANKWLAHAGTNIHVQGNPYLNSRVTEGDMLAPDAVLCRTNAAAMGAAIGYLEQGKTVAVVGGTEALKNLAFAAGELMSGKPTSHPELIAFTSWSELVEFTEEPGGGDLKALVGLINQYKVRGVIDACNRVVGETQPKWGKDRFTWEPPEIIVSTAHKSKGREWANVQVAGDFESSEPDEVQDPITEEVGPGPIAKTDAMLHYVTVTRARQHLDRGGLAWIDNHPPVDRPVGGFLEKA